MNDEDLICLSSSDEDEPRKKIKKIQPIPIKDVQPNTDSGKFNESIICLDSDEDTDSQEVIMTNNKENVETNSMSICETSNIIDQNDTDNVKELYSVKTSSTDSLNQIEYENSDSISNGNHAEKTAKHSKKEDESKTVALNDNNLLDNIEILPNEAKTFLLTCKNQLSGTECASIIYKRFPTLIKVFKDLANEISNSDSSKSFLIKQNKIASESVKACIISFKDVYQYFKSILECAGVELSKKHWKHLRKLEVVINKLLEKLKEIDEAEIDFDAEDQSSYIKHERYSQRLTKVYAKYCHILKKNPYAGRLTHERLDFVSSQHNEISLAISKKYKNNKFPNYRELSSFIREVVKEKKIPLNDVELEHECKSCFEKLGDLLQTRRKKELYEVHCSFIMDKEDPAEKDIELNKKLRISSKEGMVKIEQVCEEYVKKQELGVDEEEIDCSDENDDDEEEVEENVEDLEDEQISEDELSEESEGNQ